MNYICLYHSFSDYYKAIVDYLIIAYKLIIQRINLTVKSLELL
jgi:hypothetical protein